MTQPKLRQYTDFCPDDFEEHPIWMCVHGIDVLEPWYEEADELTFRPWSGTLPYNCSERTGPMVVARTAFRLSDGTVLSGFSHPPYPPDGEPAKSLSYRQPQMFLPGGMAIGFWLGMLSTSEKKRARLYSLLAKRDVDVFPIKYRIAKGLVDVDDSAVIDGFSRLVELSNLIVER